MNTISQTCPDAGVWRAWLDAEEAATSVNEHLSGCPACRRLVDELREDATAVNSALSVLAPARLPDVGEVAIARQRLERRGDPIRRAPPAGPARQRERAPALLSRLSTPWRVAGSALAAAVALSVIVAFTPEGGSVAAAILAKFRSQEVTPIAVTPQTQADILKTLNALGNLGTISAPGVSGAPRPEAAARAAEGQARSVTLDEAAKLVGPILTPDPSTLPAGIDKTPQVRVTPGTQVRFTFDKKKAQAYLQSTGQTGINLPDKFDGSSLVVTIPAAVMLEYGGGKDSRNALVVGEAGEVVADAEGKASLPEMRDFLLGLPGLPPTVVSQLRQIENWSETIPIPVPVDQVHWDTSVIIKGNRALMLNDNSGLGSAVIWHSGGHLYGVAGTLKARDLQSVAESLH